MPTITIPIWLLAAIAGVPTLCLMMITGRLLRHKQKMRKMGKASQQPQVSHTQVSFGGQVHQQLLAQQIDAIFNALAAVLEAERIKLKALASNCMPLSDPSGKNLTETQNRTDASERKGRSLGQSIADMTAEGTRPEDIARRLGLSDSEVALALKLHQQKDKELGGKLQAVA